MSSWVIVPWNIPFVHIILNYAYCPSWIVIAVERHHDHGSCHKGKYLIRAGLQFPRFSLLNVMSCWQTRCWRRSWEFYVLIHRQQQETVTLSVTAWASMRPQSLPPQWHTSPNKATPPNGVPPWAKHLNWSLGGGGHTYSNHHRRILFPAVFLCAWYGSCMFTF